LFRQFQNFVQLGLIIAAIVFDLERFKPDFRHPFGVDDVNVRRLVQIGRVEAEFIAFNENRWHEFMFSRHGQFAKIF